MYSGKLIFATNNPHKLEEARHILAATLQLLSLNDIQCSDELPETHETLEENALEKACYVYSQYHINCFSEDTGLEVEALNKAPGVYSARYAGPAKNNHDNINLLLEKMQGALNRKARFRAVIALILDGKQYLFEGIINGQILTEPSGKMGFGYDPIFIPDGFNHSLAQMNIEQKSKFSHRKKALDKLADFLIKDAKLIS